MVTGPINVGMGTDTGSVFGVGGMGQGSVPVSATATMVNPVEPPGATNTGTGSDGTPITPISAGFEIAVSAAAAGAYQHAHRVSPGPHHTGNSPSNRPPLHGGSHNDAAPK